MQLNQFLYVQNAHAWNSDWFMSNHPEALGMKIIHVRYMISGFLISAKYLFNKPAAQAAGADPFRCISTNRQILPIQQNRHNFWISNAIFMPFEI